MASEQPHSLGEFLRQERDKLGITLEQVASATKIGVKTLQALESDHYTDLPAKPFIRGFIISYARFVGLDAKDVLTHYNRFIDEKYRERPNREGDYSGYAFEKREGEQSRTLLWLVMGGFIVFGGIVIFFLKPSLRHHHGGHVEKLRSAQTDGESSGTPEAVASPSPGVSGMVMAEASPVPSLTTSPSPSLSFSPLPSPSRTEEAKVEAKPSHSPSPTPTPVAVVETPSPVAPPTPKFIPPTTPLVFAPAKPAESPVATVAKTDPLNSGRDYSGAALKFKIVFRALDNVTVRYKVDQKPATRFMLLKDKILVLRALSTIIFQIAEPKSITFKANGQPEQLVSDADSLVIRQNFATLYYPQQLAEKIEKPFEGETFQKSPYLSVKPDASSSPSPTP